MRGSFALLAVAASPIAAASGHRLLAANPRADPNLMTGAPDAVIRRLEDNNYINDLSGYKLEFGRCHRVKMFENTDDDGGQNLYNGRYHAKTQRYASFFLCNKATQDGCGSCDYSVEYVTDLDTYLESSVAYVQNYCGACAAQCRRRLEDEEEEEEEDDQAGNDGYGADCNTCQDQCDLYNNGGSDEINYLDCQESYVDGDGYQLYSAPTCDSSGDIVIDMFYDDECLVKHSVGNYYGFEYDTFRAIQQSCVDCYNANGMCDDLYGQTYHCTDGTNINEDNEEEEELKVCKSFREASIQRSYSSKGHKFAWVPIAIFALILVGCFAMGSYTYYVRHRNKTPLAELDHGDGTSSGMPTGTLS